MARTYRRPTFPKVGTAGASSLSRRFEAAHIELTRTINLNPIAVPSFLATKVTLAVHEATERIAALEKEARAARTARAKVWNTPRVPQMDHLFAVQAFAAFAATQKDGAKVWRDLVNKKNPTPYDRALIGAAIDLGLPVMGEATPMLYESKRKELGLPDSVTEEMEKLGELEREKSREVAEIRSVVLAGVSGASYSELSGLLTMSEERKAELREDGKGAMDSALAFEAMARTAMVRDSEVEEPLGFQVVEPAFAFRAVSE